MATAIEYGLIAAGVGLVITAGVNTFFPPKPEQAFTAAAAEETIPLRPECYAMRVDRVHHTLIKPTNCKI